VRAEVGGINAGVLSDPLFADFKPISGLVVSLLGSDLHGSPLYGFDGYRFN
jgi:hypothetical protein